MDMTKVAGGHHCGTTAIRDDVPALPKWQVAMDSRGLRVGSVDFLGISSGVGAFSQDSGLQHGGGLNRSE